MAKRLHTRVLAEGIETEEHYEFLKEIGCNFAQGFLINRPMPLDAFYDKDYYIENKSEREFYNSVGKVNFLSSNPIEDNNDIEKIYNVTPAAIIQNEDGYFTYLYANDSFVNCLNTMGVPSLEISEALINTGEVIDISRLAHNTKCTEKLDIVFNNNNVSLRLKEIADSDDIQAFYLIMFNLQFIEHAHRL